jgi:hypothetical protein
MASFLQTVSAWFSKAKLVHPTSCLVGEQRFLLEEKSDPADGGRNFFLVVQSPRNPTQASSVNVSYLNKAMRLTRLEPYAWQHTLSFLNWSHSPERPRWTSLVPMSRHILRL